LTIRHQLGSRNPAAPAVNLLFYQRGWKNNFTAGPVYCSLVLAVQTKRRSGSMQLQFRGVAILAAR